MKIQFIRIKHPEDGEGIWRSKVGNSLDYKIDSLKCYTQLEDRHSEFKTPSSDGLNLDKNQLDWFCAFKSMGQLYEWILKDEMLELISAGFIVYLIKATDYQEGEYQIIYTKESIVLKIDITNLFK